MNLLSFDIGLSITEFLEGVNSDLTGHGFNSDSTLAAVATCRDELCQPFVSAVKQHWGEAFDLNGLGGLPLGGKTAMTAASHHAPEVDGRRRMIIFGFAHLAIGANGEVGVVHRPGLAEIGGACGALARLCGEKQSGDKPEFESDDVEYGHLREALWDASSPNLLETTELAAERIHQQLINQTEGVISREVFDYTIFSGVLVHYDGRGDRVYLMNSESLISE